jgi:ubiquinone/menaquinone biosynthesis C-methylase UbiE
VSFEVPAEDYTRYMGRWSEPLARLFADVLDLAPGKRVLDVGSGPGALTAVLVERLGPDDVVAVDPSPPFVAALSARFPGLDVRRASAEALPLDDDSVDVAAAQLVVHFMSDPEAGLRDMVRVTRPGGLVAACVWDHAGGTGPLSPFWKAAHTLVPDVVDESGLFGSRQGELQRLFSAVGATDIEEELLTVRHWFVDMDDWWQPFTFGVGPAGSYVAGLDAAGREELRAACVEVLPSPPFEQASSAWCVTGRVAR